MLAPKHRKIQEMASEYRFDYKKAKPNRFAQKMNLNVGWTIEIFMEGEKEKPKLKNSMQKKKVSKSAKKKAKGKK